MRLIDADALKERLKEYCIDGDEQAMLWYDLMGIDETIDDAPTIDAVQGWIPVKWHEITDEERNREGYPKDWVTYIDCEMPCDEQEILVQTKNGYIRWDVCYEDGEFSLDSGWDWVEDIVAWMPLPEPYEGESDE